MHTGQPFVGSEETLPDLTPKQHTTNWACELGKEPSSSTFGACLAAFMNILAPHFSSLSRSVPSSSSWPCGLLERRRLPHSTQSCLSLDSENREAPSFRPMCPTSQHLLSSAAIFTELYHHLQGLLVSFSFLFHLSSSCPCVQKELPGT